MTHFVKNSSAQGPIFEYYRLERHARVFKEQSFMGISLVYYLKAFKHTDECPNSVLVSALEISEKLKNQPAEIVLKTEIEKQKLKFNPEYSKQVNKLFKKDQRAKNARNMRARKNYINCIASGDCSQSKMFKYLNEWNRVDSTNINKLISLMDKYGSPSEKHYQTNSLRSSFYYSTALRPNK